jgi:hypothetical protein
MTYAKDFMISHPSYQLCLVANDRQPWWLTLNVNRASLLRLNASSGRLTIIGNLLVDIECQVWLTIIGNPVV